MEVLLQVSLLVERFREVEGVDGSKGHKRVLVTEKQGGGMRDSCRTYTKQKDLMRIECEIKYR